MLGDAWESILPQAGCLGFFGGGELDGLGTGVTTPLSTGESAWED